MISRKIRARDRTVHKTVRDPQRLPITVAYLLSVWMNFMKSVRPAVQFKLPAVLFVGNAAESLNGMQTDETKDDFRPFSAVNEQAGEKRGRDRRAFAEGTRQMMSASRMTIGSAG